MLSDIMLSVIKLSVFMPSVILNCSYTEYSGAPVVTHMNKKIKGHSDA